MLTLRCVRLPCVKKGYAAALRFLTAAVILGGVCLIALGFLEERIAFHPSRLIDATPRSVGIGFEDLRLRTADGETLAGWWMPAADPATTLLFLHGNAGNISHRLYHVALLHQAGFSLLMLDYRGYGESTGSPTEPGLTLDARAGWEHLTGSRGIDPGRIVIYGESIGSVPSLRLALELREAGEPGPAALVLEGAFTSALDMGRRVLPFLPLRLILSLKMDNLSAVRRVQEPVLFIHGARDEIVPIRMGRRLHEASASAAKEFLEIPGAMHNTVWMEGGEEIPGRIRSFLERVARSG
jgi:fermentation-respiration switch protein FrsA (DUF1100 family)